MKIISVKSLALPDVKVIRFGRFSDHRGYFTEHFRRQDVQSHAELSFLAGVDFVQMNESCSSAGTMRGIHTQWDPPMGKLVRTVAGRMVDFAVDLRKSSPFFGKLVVYDMPSARDDEFGEWIWVPPGFGHGNFFLEDSIVEYFCSGSYNPAAEAGICPLAEDLDWSLCGNWLRKEIQNAWKGELLMTEKDRSGLTLQAWKEDPRSNHQTFHTP